jgi:hypothetical protein
MQGRCAGDADEISIHCDSRDPRESLTGKNERPRVAIFAWHTRVDQDVLQLARTTAAGRPHAQSRAPVAKMQSEV